MKRLGFYVALPFIYFISILPFRILYIISDFFYLIVYYIIGYRKHVVRQNLKNSFPEKTEKELLKIEKDFFHYIVDFFLEMFKSVTISQNQLKKRFSIENDEILEKLLKENKNIIVTAGHYGNHELANLALSFLIKHKVKGVYKPLSNEYFEKFFLDFRTRFGTQMIKMRDASTEIAKVENFNYAFFLVNDQSPPPERSYWTTFLNQETGFFTGHERFAKQYNMPVVYMCINKIGRGRYRIRVDLLTENPNLLADGEIIELHARKLENDIKSNPSIWFWSHKRWKFTKKGNEVVELKYKK
jgi:Kdo2-lipid IVA lauroyltransferase/acyltransferase